MTDGGSGVAKANYLRPAEEGAAGSSPWDAVLE